MENTDSFTPQEYAKMVGMFPDAPNNPLPTGGYMDEGFDWVVNQAEGADGTRVQVVIGASHGSTENWTRIFTINSPYSEAELYDYVIPMSVEPAITRYEESFYNYNRDFEGVGDEPTSMRVYIGCPSGSTVDWQMEKMIEAFGDEDILYHFTGELEDIIKNKLSSRPNDYQAESGDLDCDECGAINETIGYVQEGYKLCEPCDREWMAKQGYEAEMTKDEKDIDAFADRVEILEDLEDVADYGAERVYSDSNSETYQILVQKDKFGEWKLNEEYDDYYDDLETALSDFEKAQVSNYGVKLTVTDEDGRQTVAYHWSGGMLVGKPFDKPYDTKAYGDIKINMAESKKQSKSMFTKDKRGRMYARNRKGQIITHNAENQSAVYEPSSEPTGESPATEPTNENPNLFGSEDETCPQCGGTNTGYEEVFYCYTCGDVMDAENESAVYQPSSEPTGESPATEPTNENPNLFGSDMLKPIKKNKDWLSLALGTTAVVLGGGLFAQSKGWLNFGADGDEAKEEGDLPPAPAEEPSLVASPSTGDLLPADYEEMIVESTGYAVPVIPVGLDGSFMGSRFHALPTDRLIESNEPGVGSHTDVAMYRDTNYREPEQSMVTEPPFAYRFNSESECECSFFEKIKSFFTGKDCCEGKETKEANSITGQTPYFGYGFEGKNPQARVIKETNPISLDPSTAPYLPLNLSGYTGQAYTPPSIYADMMAIGSSGMNVPFSMPAQSSVGANHFGSRSIDSSSLKSVNGNLNESVNQSYTDGSRTMSLAQWSIEYDVSQISDTEAYAVSRSSGERKMIRRV